MGSEQEAEDRADLELQVQQLQRALETTQRLAHVGTWEYDLRSATAYWSDEMFRLYGYEPGEIAPTRETSLRRTHPDDHQLLVAWGEDMVAHPGEEREVDMRIVLPGGGERLVKQRALFVSRDDGAIQRLVGTVQDWTAEVRSRQTETLLAQIVTSVSDAIYTIDTELHVLTWNPAAERLYGYTAEEMIGQSLELLYAARRGRTWREGEARRTRLFTGETEFEEYETVRKHKDGRLIEVALRTSPLRDHAGNVIGAVGSARDMTERRRIEAQLAHYATHDVITGLFNRPRFEEELTAAGLRAEQEGHAGAVLMIDLDNFRYVNETHGHNTGDELVASLAGALPRHLRDTDILARFGGDEFAVLLSPCTEQSARKLADELLRAVREHELEVGGSPLRISASIGVVTFSGTATNATELLSDVDRAMYQSKEAGRDRVTVVTPSERTWVREQLNHSAEHMIHSALDNNQFELYVQPIVDLRDGRMTHCEVLLRLNNEGAVIAPGQFLPAAERLGLIHLIDRWVIDRAFALASRHSDLIFEINLSGATIDDEHLPTYVAERLRAHGTDPGSIVFEITETAAVGNIAKARELAHRVSELGCTFAIDDFGTGFSTFYYLKHFPAQYIKIDGEFLSDGQSRMDDLVIESIVKIGRDLGKQTIAEYVSDETRLQRVRKLGVDYAQGFHFSRPFPAHELGSFPRQLIALDGAIRAD
jgi:diguanylate cyclase (GGDEF)-like protein/PAS domain S-box-containing protein